MLNVYQFLSIFHPHFHRNQKAARTRSNCPAVLEQWIFSDHNFYVFVDGVVIKIFVYLLITNPLLYANIVSLLEQDMET